ncbi:tumor necrosis factor b (TNF superfamily, member 2) [Synchiropus splendidus]|uniref:tumor necrosis factor b (TNF superfamily, member 2) n=1 Tax=Synchiropus splendidus TaxID=270530 RepID=UPI00237E4CA2|nr:tumor necrosis factor b (TNF superfamily, member 2) [Synchiropus splendidus]
MHKMVAYTAAPGDVETGENTLVKMESNSSRWIWKLLVSILAVTLCVVGVLLSLWLWNGRPDLMAKLGQTELLTQKGTDHQITLRQIGTTAKAAIHLEGSYDKAEPKSLVWKNGQGQAFAQGGLELVDNRIRIPRKGLYFVYSQASFRINCSDDDEDSEDPGLMSFSHRIWRDSDMVGGKSTLMGAVRSACQHGTQETGWYNAIYLGAVFQLNTGDDLSTETSKLSEVETEDSKTFFGVFAL